MKQQTVVKLNSGILDAFLFPLNNEQFQICEVFTPCLNKGYSIWQALMNKLMSGIEVKHLPWAIYIFIQYNLKLDFKVKEWKQETNDSGACFMSTVPP